MKKYRKTKVFLLIITVLGMVISGVIFYMKKETPKEANTDYIPVLGYHNIAKDKDKQAYWRFDAWTSSLSSFEKQMQYLADHEYQTISIEDFYAWKQGKKEYSNKTVLITFDDSYYSTPLLAEPILKKYGFQAVTFVIGYSIPSQDIKYDPSLKQHIPMALLKDNETMTYESHFYHLHRKIDDEYAINTYSEKALRKDIQKAKAMKDTDYFAYPFGKYTKKAQKALKAENVKLAFRYHQFQSVKRQEDNYALSRYSVNAYTPMFVFQYMVNH